MAEKRGPGRAHALLFGAGDCAFLAFISALATMTMYATHRLGWDPWLTWVAGMAAAMAIQSLLVLFVSPLLGSIESMVPSMIVAMLSPMVVCLAEMAGHEMSSWMSCASGTAFGLGMYGLVELYGWKCRRALRRTFPPGGCCENGLGSPG